MDFSSEFQWLYTGSLVSHIHFSIISSGSFVIVRTLAILLEQRSSCHNKKKETWRNEEGESLSIQNKMHSPCVCKVNDAFIRRTVRETLCSSSRFELLHRFFWRMWLWLRSGQLFFRTSFLVEQLPWECRATDFFIALSHVKSERPLVNPFLLPFSLTEN